MKIEDMMIGMPVMTEAIDYLSKDGNFKPIYRRRMGYVKSFTLNSMGESICVVEIADYDFTGCSSSSYITNIHPSNLIPYTTEGYFEWRYK